MNGFFEITLNSSDSTLVEIPTSHKVVFRDPARQSIYNKAASLITTELFQRLNYLIDATDQELETGLAKLRADVKGS